MLKTMSKSSRHVENVYVSCVENVYVSCVENVYVTCVKNHVENCVEVRKKSTVTFHFLVRIYTIF